VDSVLPADRARLEHARFRIPGNAQNAIGKPVFLSTGAGVLGAVSDLDERDLVRDERLPLHEPVCYRLGGGLVALHERPCGAIPGEL
jgi:hypothetical protein